MNTGKSVRLASIFRRDTGRTVIVALDHGGIAGPMPGIVKPAEVVRACREGGADAILATRGVVSAAAGEWDRSLAIVMRLTGGFTVLGGQVRGGDDLHAPRPPSPSAPRPPRSRSSSATSGKASSPGRPPWSPIPASGWACP